MPIRLFTGLPGAGKSLSLVDALRRMHQKEPGRPVYAFGIPGLRPDLAKPCDPNKWEELPDGSIVVIDEVQDVWPSGERGQTKAHIRALSKHRHRGFDFLISSQRPAFIDKYVFGLVSEHTHIVRRWWGSSVDKYVWQEGQEDVQRQSVRARGQRSKWKFPKECFDLYKSSSLHTGKRRLPWQYWMMIGAGVLAVPMIWYAVHRVVGLRHLASDSGVVPVSSASVDRPSFAVGGEEKKRWATVDDYVKDHIPRVANQPWSAPVFDQEAIAAKPDLLCIEYHRVVNDVDQQLCSCYTEQVTPYDLHSLEECRRYARHGVYNPRRAPIGADRFAEEHEQGQHQRSQRPAAEAPADAAGNAGAWQPAWRTREYVQPERTSVTATVSESQQG